LEDAIGVPVGNEEAALLQAEQRYQSHDEPTRLA
jgi:hypothetical protein